MRDAEADAKTALHAAGFDSVDYLETRESCALTRLGPGPATVPARLLAAARLGATRLLDNLEV